MIKHISFDLWLTLIKSNPKYKIEKARFLAQLLDQRLNLEVPVNEHICLAVIRTVGKAADYAAEHLEAAYTPKQIIFNLLATLTGQSTVPVGLIEEVQTGFDKLILEYCPQLYSEQTKPSLLKLREMGISMNIASNTGFTCGKTMDQILKKLGIFDLFEFRIYSEEIGYSKPHSNFFHTVWNRLWFRNEEILHVGDNPLADGEGALAAGFETFIINSNSHKIEDIFEILTVPVS